MFAAVVCSSRRVKRETASASVGGGAPTDVPGPSGSASFSVAWNAPAYDEGGMGQGGNGAAELAGYVIDYATSSQAANGGAYPYRKVVSGAGAVSGVVSGIATGTYYLRMAAYDGAGNVGNYSNEIAKVAA